MENVASGKAASLAVLPFENLSDDKQYEYFSRGLVEELIVDLSHFPGLQIISSYTSRRLSDLELDVLEAARKIDVEYLLKGSLYQQPEAIRLSMQLLHTGSGKLIWAERFDAPRDGVFDIQKSILERVVFTISSEVDHTLLTAAREKPVTNMAAYDCWLRGMDRLSLGTLEADREAREFFNQALTIDPHYARAYSGLSLSHFNEWSCQLWELYEVSEKSAYKYASEAFRLDDSDYLVQMILGRVYLYRRQFDEAEYHISRSLELNSNDADNLVQLASCLAFLGRAAEGERLFKKALNLNPYRNLWYYQYGSLVYFVLRNFSASVEMALKRPLTNVWVDLPGYIASAYAHMERSEEAKQYVGLFVNAYISSITKGRKPSVDEVVNWLAQANPFRYAEDRDSVVEGILKAGLEEALGSSDLPNYVSKEAKLSRAEAIFKKEQAIWHVVFGGVETTMPDLKGLQDIAWLLSTPEKEVHCTDLMGAESSMDENEYTMDEQARSQYERRVRELQEDITEAEQLQDLGRKEKLRQELEYLLDHLEKNLGLGGKTRKLKSSAERARAAVTLRIRSAIKKIEKHNPVLAKHLANSLRTGVFCCYSPEEKVEWVLH